MKIIGTEFLKAIPGVFGVHLDTHAKYDVIQKGELEIRKYAAMTWASITVHDTPEMAVNKAFTALASYTFSHDIPMTVPIFQSLVPKGITLSFFIEPGHHLPKPINKKITIERIPERFVAVHSYSVINVPSAMKKAKAELKDHLRTLEGFSPKGEVFWAQYDSPMTIPFLRTNEAMIELQRLS